MSGPAPSKHGLWVKWTNELDVELEIRRHDFNSANMFNEKVRIVF